MMIDRDKWKCFVEDTRSLEPKASSDLLKHPFYRNVLAVMWADDRIKELEASVGYLKIRMAASIVERELPREFEEIELKE